MKCYNIKWSRAKEKDHLFFQLEERTTISNLQLYITNWLSKYIH